MYFIRSRELFQEEAEESVLKLVGLQVSGSVLQSLSSLMEVAGGCQSRSEVAVIRKCYRKSNYQPLPPLADPMQVS